MIGIPITHHIPSDWDMPRRFPFRAIYEEAARLGIPIRLWETSTAPIRMAVWPWGIRWTFDDIPHAIAFLRGLAG